MTFHSTVLFIQDIKKSKNFYLELLGFTVDHDFGKNIILNAGISLWEIQSEHIIYKQTNMRVDSSRFELCFENSNIEKIYIFFTKRWCEIFA